MDIVRMRKELDKTLNQLSSGKKSTSLSGYSGSEIREILDLKSENSQNESYKQNSEIFKNRGEAILTALNTMNKLVQDVTKEADLTVEQNVSEMKILKKYAGEALNQFTDLLGSKYDGRYMFGDTQPTDKQTTDIYKQSIQQRFDNVKLIGTKAEDVINLTKNITDVGTPYKADYKEQTISIPTSNGITSNLGLNAKDEGFKKVLRGLATLSSIPENVPAEQYGEMKKIIDEAVSSLKEGTKDLNEKSGITGVKINAVQTRMDYKTQMTAINEQRLSDIENVSIEETFMKASSMQTQLVAAYNVLKTKNSLSLVNYI